MFLLFILTCHGNDFRLSDINRRIKVKSSVSGIHSERVSTQVFVIFIAAARKLKNETFCMWNWFSSSFRDGVKQRERLSSFAMRDFYKSAAKVPKMILLTLALIKLNE